MDTTTYKTKLDEERATLEAELETVGRRNPANPKDWEATQPETEQQSDPLDRAATLDSYQENVAILTDLEARYGDVTAALAKIEDGTYGTCEKGEEAIEEDRLGADPAARTCKAHMNG